MLDVFIIAAQPFGTWGPGLGPEPLGYWARILDAIANDPLAVATILAAIIASFFGFLFGTLIKYGLDRRADRLRRKADRRILATALRAELTSLESHAKNRITLLDQQAPHGLHYTALDLPPQLVYASTTDRIGELGAKTAPDVITAHGAADHIRTVIAASRDSNPDRQVTPDGRPGLRVDVMVLLYHTKMAINSLDQLLDEEPSRPDAEAIRAEIVRAGPYKPSAAP